MSFQGAIISEGGPESIADLRERVGFLTFMNKHLEERLQEQEAKNKDFDREVVKLKFAREQLTRRLQEAKPVPRNTNSADIASLKAQLEARDSMIAEARKDYGELMKQLLLVGDAHMEAMLTMNNQSAIKEEVIDKVAKSLPSVAAQEWMGHWEAAKRRHEEDPTADDYATELQSTAYFSKTQQCEQPEYLLPRAFGFISDSDDETLGPSRILESGGKQKDRPDTEPVSGPKPRETQSEAARRIAGDVPKTQPSSQEGKGNVRDQTLSVTKTAAPPSKNRFILEIPQPPPSQQSLDLFGHFSVAEKGAGKKAAPTSKGGGAKRKTTEPESEEVSKRPANSSAFQSINSERQCSSD